MTPQICLQSLPLNMRFFPWYLKYFTDFFWPFVYIELKTRDDSEQGYTSNLWIVCGGKPCLTERSCEPLKSLDSYVVAASRGCCQLCYCYDFDVCLLQWHIHDWDGMMLNLHALCQGEAPLWRTLVKLAIPPKSMMLIPLRGGRIHFFWSIVLSSCHFMLWQLNIQKYRVEWMTSPVTVALFV